MIKYRLRILFNEITVVEIKDETEKYITLSSGRQVKKDGRWIMYFNSWVEAHNRLLSIKRQCVEDSMVQLEQDKKELEDVEAMGEPTNEGKK